MILSYHVPGGWIFGIEVSRQRKLLYLPDKIHAWRIPAQSVSPTVLQYFSAYLPLTFAVKILRLSSIPETQIVIKFMD